MRNKTYQLIDNHIIKNKPDLIISVVPIINNIILDASKKNNIPFFLIPTDLDATTFIHRINTPTYKKFKLCLAFNNADISKTIKPAQISPNQIETTGFILRPDFFVQKNIKQLKQEFYIPENKSIVMVFMGSMGSEEIVRFAQELFKLTTPTHLLLCIGKTEKVRKQIETLICPEHISKSIIGFTERIADLMALSDLLITKSGSVSVCEAIYMQVPMLLDATSTVLKWEQFNHHFIKKNQFGDSIKKFTNLTSLVTTLLANKKQLAIMRHKLKTL